MDEKTLKNIEKWQAEIKTLESVKRQVKKFTKLKDEKADTEDIAKTNSKIVELFEESKFMKLDWLEIKRSKASREEGIEKIDKKIADRQKKLDDAGAESEAQIGESEETTDVVAAEPTDSERDWTNEIESCAPEQILYHWAYGKMQVVAMEDDYIYMRPLDRKGCKHEWLQKNNAIVEIDGKEEEVKEFSLYSIGRWLYPEIDDVTVMDQSKAHKMFAAK